MHSSQKHNWIKSQIIPIFNWWRNTGFCLLLWHGLTTIREANVKVEWLKSVSTHWSPYWSILTQLMCHVDIIPLVNTTLLGHSCSRNSLLRYLEPHLEGKNCSWYDQLICQTEMEDDVECNAWWDTYCVQCYLPYF